MANRLRGEASFEHDGDELTLVIDVDVFMQVESATGVGLLAMREALNKLTVMAELMRAGLKSGCDLRITRAAAAEMIMLNDAAREAVIDALNLALPDDKTSGGGAEDGDEADPIPSKPKAKAKAGTGKKS